MSVKRETVFIYLFCLLIKTGDKNDSKLNEKLPNISSAPEESKSPEAPTLSPKPAPAPSEPVVVEAADEEAAPAPAPKPEATKRAMIPKAGMPMMGGSALLAEMKKRQNKDKVQAYFSLCRVGCLMSRVLTTRES